MGPAPDWSPKKTVLAPAPVKISVPLWTRRRRKWSPAAAAAGHDARAGVVGHVAVDALVAAEKAIAPLLRQSAGPQRAAAGDEAGRSRW